MLTTIFTWLLIGIVVGFIARLIVPGKQDIGMMATIGFGVLGALLGGLISWLFTGATGEPFSAHAWPGWLMSVLGAVILLWAFVGRGHRGHGTPHVSR